MIFLGFFTCGYQLAFITAHLPGFTAEMFSRIASSNVFHSIGICTTSALRAIYISLIGFANVAGTLMAGHLGNKFSRKDLLSLIYSGYTIIAAIFRMTPTTPTTFIVFSICIRSL